MAASAVVVISRETVEGGWHLRQALIEAQFPFTAMFWAEFDENDWRLFLAAPLPDAQRPKDPYRWLRTILYTLPEAERESLDLSDIVLVRPEARIVSEVRRRYGIVSGDRRAVRRLSLSPYEAYVYELRPDGQASEQGVELAVAAV